MCTNKTMKSIFVVKIKNVENKWKAVGEKGDVRAKNIRYNRKHKKLKKSTLTRKQMEKRRTKHTDNKYTHRWDLQ